MPIAMAKRGSLLNIMPKRCRICLTDSGFMVKLRDKFVEPKLTDLTRCTCIDIEYKKNLPDGVCHICFYKLSMWAEFKELFIQSHKTLLEQLEVSETSNNVVNNSKNTLLQKNVKRTHSNRSSGNSISPIDKKKSKIDVSLSNTDQATIHTICISDSEDDSDFKDSFQKVCNINSRKLNKNAENSNEEHMENKSPLESKRSKLSRVRNNKNKRRMALKRWKERKKALYIATRKDASDSDSEGSNDAQLTPVQKAPTTKEDKEVKKQKRIAKILKQLKTDLTEKYIGFSNTNTNINTPRTRLRNQTTVISPSEKSNIRTRTRYDSTEKESSPSLVKNSVTANSTRKPTLQTNSNAFTPKTLQTELVIGKTTFIVTSNLILQDKQCNQTLNNSKKNFESLNGDVNENSEEKNTDIIDAVQLRRVTPVKFDKRNDIERCLDIRIESHEFAILKHMQNELSDFIQKEVKHKLDMNKSIMKSNSVDNTNSQLKLNQKLKNLIQDALEKNIERLIDGNDIEHQGFQRVSPEFIKKAIHLPQYQPKVVVERLDLTNKDNIANALKRAAPRSESHSAISHKRHIVLPKKYDDFNVSVNSDFSDLEDIIVEKAPRPAYPRVYKKSTIKQFNNNKVAIEKQVEKNDSTVQLINNTTNKDNTMSVLSIVRQDLMNGKEIDRKKIEIKNLTNVEFYMCKICKSTFNSQKDIDAHVHTFHSTVPTTFVMSMNKSIDISPQQKQKKMRCKKCLEIVEYQSVKAHAFTCKMMTPTYVCDICDSNFNIKKLFLEHIKTHNTKLTSKLTNKIEKKEINNVDASLQIETTTYTISQQSQTVGLQLQTVSEALQKGYAIQTNKEGICVMPLKNQTNESNVQSATIDNSNIQSDNVITTDTKSDNVIATIDDSNIQSDNVITIDAKSDNAIAKSDVAKNIVKNKEYICFVCDKIFTDENVLKDHLQQHCDDLNDDLHKCNICDDILDSDKALEEHICKHWFDGEGNDLNNTSVNNENNIEDGSSTEDEIYQCSQCWEMFDSELLLEMHTRVHVQEVPAAKQRKQVVYQYQCTLCDDLFDTENDLMDHLNLHNSDAQVCQLCDKPFRTIQELQAHVTTHL